MIKTIKVKKQLRLDELIKYIFDNEIEDTKYPTSEIAPFGECEARISGSGNIKLNGYINRATTFTVEVEEEITEDTKIPKTATIMENGKINSSWNNSIKGLKSYYPGAVQIHAIINGKLELIWERESDEI